MRLAAAAHIHRFNLVNAGMGNPAAAGPVQFVAGNSGVALSGSDRDLVCDRDDVEWTPDDGDKREEKWVGVRTSNYGYMLASFSVNADNRVSADYRAPMFDSKGAPEPSLEVACSGDRNDWSRLSCPSFAKTESETPKCAE